MTTDPLQWIVVGGLLANAKLCDRWLADLNPAWFTGSAQRCIQKMQSGEAAGIRLTLAGLGINDTPGESIIDSVITHFVAKGKSATSQETSERLCELIRKRQPQSQEELAEVFKEFALNGRY